MHKKKLKILRGKLKEWNKDVFGNIQWQNFEIKKATNEIDKKDEMGVMNEEDVKSIRDLFVDFKKVVRREESLMYRNQEINGLRRGTQILDISNNLQLEKDGEFNKWFISTW